MLRKANILKVFKPKTQINFTKIQRQPTKVQFSKNSEHFEFGPRGSGSNFGSEPNFSNTTSYDIKMYT